MRKISQMMMLGAMAATMWSCSSDNAPDSPDKNDPAFKGDGYLAVQIRLPQVPSSRANDNFDDGTDNEYAVDNVALILFKGENEGDASVVGCYELNNGFKNTDPSNDNITSTSLEAVEVSNLTLSTTDKLYGLVVVNYDGVLTFTNKKADLAVNGTSITDFSGLLKIESGNAFYTGSGTKASKFFMTNAVLSKNPGGTSNPGTEPSIFTLVDLSANLYSTADEAKEHPAGCIYVERAVAKVTSSQTNTTTTIGGQEFNVTIEYALDNCEPTSFVVRNSPAGSTDFAWNLKNPKTTNYRMIGNAPMPALTDPNHPSVQYYYRTYWCTDPHYTDKLTTEDTRPENYNHLTFVSLEETVNGKSVASPLYCHENTFPVNEMTYGNTTRVVYKVTLTPVVSEGAETDGHLYILDGNKQKIYLTAKAVQSRGEKEIVEYPGIKTALENIKKKGAEATYDISDVIKVVYGADDKGDFKITAITLNEKAENFDVCFGEDAKAVIAKFEADNASMLEGLIKTVNAKNVITKYTGGVSYYDIRVAHFDDDLTPWTEKVGEDPGTVYGSGADAANAYLGRYGMVRNNWYDLKVNNILGIGSPVVPKLDINLSDDNKKDKKYIAIEIHTMSWAKRTHNYDLE